MAPKRATDCEVESLSVESEKIQRLLVFWFRNNIEKIFWVKLLQPRECQTWWPVRCPCPKVATTTHSESQKAELKGYSLASSYPNDSIRTSKNHDKSFPALSGHWERADFPRVSPIIYLGTGILPAVPASLPPSPSSRVKKPTRFHSPFHSPVSRSPFDTHRFTSSPVQSSLTPPHWHSPPLSLAPGSAPGSPPGSPGFIKQRMRQRSRECPW